MAEDFGDGIGAAAAQAAKAAAKSVTTPVSLAEECRDMIAACKALEAAGGTDLREHINEKAEFSR